MKQGVRGRGWRRRRGCWGGNKLAEKRRQGKRLEEEKRWQGTRLEEKRRQGKRLEEENIC